MSNKKSPSLRVMPCREPVCVFQRLFIINVIFLKFLRLFQSLQKTCQMFVRT